MVDPLVGWLVGQSVGRSVFSGRDWLAIYVVLLLLEGETDDILNCLGMEGFYVITYLRESKRLCNCQLSGTSLFVIFKPIKLPFKLLKNECQCIGPLLFFQNWLRFCWDIALGVVQCLKLHLTFLMISKRQEIHVCVNNFSTNWARKLCYLSNYSKLNCGLKPL